MSLIDEHVARFNTGVRTGDREPMLELFDDEILLLSDRRRYAWSREPERPAGETELVEREGRIASLRILYETFSA